MLLATDEQKQIHWHAFNHDVIKWKHFPRCWPCVRGYSLVTDEFPTQRPVTRSFDVFFDLHLNKRLNKRWGGWWIKTPSLPLWCHCNVYSKYLYFEIYIQTSYDPIMLEAGTSVMFLLYQSVRHESESGWFKSPSDRDIFCLKNFDNVARTSFRVSKMNAVARAQLTYQTFTLLKKILLYQIKNDIHIFWYFSVNV